MKLIVAFRSFANTPKQRCLQWFKIFPYPVGKCRIEISEISRCFFVDFESLHSSASRIASAGDAFERVISIWSGGLLLRKLELLNRFYSLVRSLTSCKLWLE